MPNDYDDFSRSTGRLIRVGSVLDARFELICTIGTGSFGRVYRAYDREEGRRVAVKTLLPRSLADPELVQRFAREAAICTLLRHPNMPELIHCGQVVDEAHDRRVPYMVFELVQGHTATDIISGRGPLTARETASVASRVLDFLDEAHRAGILHRDLKPDNVLILAPEDALMEPRDRGTRGDRLGIPDPRARTFRDIAGFDVKVIDWGLGKILQNRGMDLEALTMEGVVPGTSQYMSPEQVLGAKDIDFRSDVYAVSMLMYRLLTGRPAYDGARAVEVALKHVTEPLTPLPRAWATHPIARVYARGAEKDRNERYATAGEMAEALRQVLEAEEDGAPPGREPVWSRMLAGLRRRSAGRTKGGTRDEP